MNKLLLTCLLAGIGTCAMAQNLASGLTLDAEISATGSSGDHSPLWLNSNRYGMSSTESWSAYQRVKLSRSEDNDSLRNWQFGYALDLALMENSASVLNVQQAYIKAAYRKVSVTIGSKEQPMVMKNQALSSGGLGLGINARPIPQMRFDIDYFSIPGTNQWWKWKANMSYGFTTDGNWQRSFVAEGERYTSNHLYHEKALYWKFGKENHPVVPLTYEIGISMSSQFGGTLYNITGRNHRDKTVVVMPSDLRSWVDALFCRGHDVTDGTEANTAGNHLGSYNMALAWHGEKWKAKAYFERFFEDQSMLTVQYGIQDHLIGVEGELPANPFLSTIVIEHISTKNQSGAVYHDQTASIPDKMNGRDNYYNHNLYSGWQHWGQTIGNPLITSPSYNASHKIQFDNNRIKGWHIGLSGDPSKSIHWRMLLSLTQNWGTYVKPYVDVRNQMNLMGEVTWTPSFLKGWSGKMAMGYDNGSVIGNSFGAQLSIHKTLNLMGL